MKWTKTGCSVPEQVKSKKSIASVLSNKKDIWFNYWFEKGICITFQHFGAVGRKTSWKKTRFSEEEINFEQDNTLTHKSSLKMDKLNKSKYEFLGNKQYSKDLAPNDYYIVKNLK